jgi:hypothetical protein
MEQEIFNFINSTKFKNIVPKFKILQGELKNFKDKQLENNKGIYFLYCNTLGYVSYIGLTEKGFSSRFDRHIGRSEGKIYDKNQISKNWDYFAEWVKDTKYNYRNKGKYICVDFQDDITKKQLQRLETRAIHEFYPLINDDTFDEGEVIFEKIKEDITKKMLMETENSLFEFK